MKAVSLVEMCVEKVSRDVMSYSAGDLSSLPRHLAEEIVQRVVEGRQPLLHELLIFCEAFWCPSSLSLHNHLPLHNHALLYLSYVPSLVKLDLSCNPWLDSLAFLPQLVQLQCLNLRDCWRLSEQSLSYIAGLPKLSCLDLQNVYSLTDGSASTFLPGITTLRSLNLSRTGVSDRLLETLTYGQRLRSWMAKEHVSRYAGASDNSIGSLERGCDLQMESHLQQWKPLELVYLRLQHTRITESSLPFLLSFEKLNFLDVRDTEISGRSLKSLQARHNLISLPNNLKMLARWNSLILAAFQDSCGCLSLGVGGTPNGPDICREQPDWTTQWEQDGIRRLLGAANRLRTDFS